MGNASLQNGIDRNVRLEPVQKRSHLSGHFLRVGCNKMDTLLSPRIRDYTHGPDFRRAPSADVKRRKLSFGSLKESPLPYEQALAGQMLMAPLRCIEEHGNNPF